MRRANALALGLAAALALAGAGGQRAAAQVYNSITNCYEDPSHIAPDFCPGENQGPRGPAPPPEPDVFGALAISPSSLAWGTSWNYRAEGAAQAEALRRCRAAGARDCRVAVTVADVCVSLAISNQRRLYAVGGPTGASNFAANNAMLKCRRTGAADCAVATSFCADGQRHVLNGTTQFYNGNPVFTPNGQQPFGRR